ncbi:UNVERIFIED_CONTAM: hypothetical protein HDU68_009374, partial [Siphonaria sp. JEL0065]
SHFKQWPRSAKGGFQIRQLKHNIQFYFSVPAATTSARAASSAPLFDLLGADEPVATNTNSSNDEWGDFASATTTTTTSQPISNSTGFANFASFQSATPLAAAPQQQPPAVTSSFDDIGDVIATTTTTTTSSTSSTIPTSASFNTLPVSSQQQQQHLGLSNLSTQFASFNLTTTATPVSSATKATTPSNSNGFANVGQFGGSVLTPVKPTVVPSGGLLGGFSTPPANNGNGSGGSDAFSKLVSLDPKALSGMGEKDVGAGPSLSSISTAQTHASFGFGGTQQQQQQQIRPPGYGGGLLSPVGGSAGNHGGVNLMSPVKPKSDFDSLI